MATPPKNRWLPCSPTNWLDLSGQYLDATDALAVADVPLLPKQFAGSAEKKYGGWGDFLKNNPDKIG